MAFTPLFDRILLKKKLRFVHNATVSEKKDFWYNNGEDPSLAHTSAWNLVTSDILTPLIKNAEQDSMSTSLVFTIELSSASSKYPTDIWVVLFLFYVPLWPLQWSQQWPLRRSAIFPFRSTQSQTSRYREARSHRCAWYPNLGRKNRLNCRLLHLQWITIFTVVLTSKNCFRTHGIVDWSKLVLVAGFRMNCIYSSFHHSCLRKTVPHGWFKGSRIWYRFHMRLAHSVELCVSEIGSPTSNCDYS